MAPEKRPSVTSATDSPRPAPTTEEVTLSISRMPGRPRVPRSAARARRPARRAPPGSRPRTTPRRRTRAPGPVCARRSVPGELHHAAVGSEVAAQRVERAARLERPDHLAVRGSGASAADLGEGAAVDGGRAAVHVAAADQLADQGGRAAGAVQVGGNPAPAGHEVGDHRRARADLGQLVEREGDARLARDRQQVQEAVGGAAAGHHARHRVLERAAIEEAARADPALRQRHRQRASALRRGVLLVEVRRRDQAVAHDGEPEEVDRDRHRVGREVAGAEARRRGRPRARSGRARPARAGRARARPRPPRRPGS